jgi:hypothetical protein
VKGALSQHRHRRSRRTVYVTSKSWALRADPFNFRVEQVILRKGLAAADAHKLVAKSDQDRQAFIEKYFHQQIANPHTHGAILNVEHLVQDDAVRLIVDAVHAWVTRSGFKKWPKEESYRKHSQAHETQ